MKKVILFIIVLLLMFASIGCGHKWEFGDQPPSQPSVDMSWFVPWYITR